MIGERCIKDARMILDEILLLESSPDADAFAAIPRLLGEAFDSLMCAAEGLGITEMRLANGQEIILFEEIVNG